MNKKKVGDKVMYFGDRGDHGVVATVTGVHSTYCYDLDVDGLQYPSVCFRDSPGQAATWGEIPDKKAAGADHATQDNKGKVRTSNV